MNTILLAVALTVSTNRVSVHFTVPQAGTYRVMQSADMWHWTVLASKRCKAGEHGTAKLPDVPVGFVRVEPVPSNL